jgi:hypothetical protein
MHLVAWYDTASSSAAATVGASSRSAGANSREILDRQMIGMTSLQLPLDAVYFLLTMRVHLAYGAGARWSNGMSGHEVQADANLLSAFVLMIGGALGAALPLTIVIIWICS